jgi:hypothetical protein
MHRRRFLQTSLSALALSSILGIAYFFRQVFKDRKYNQVPPTLIKGFILADPRNFRMASAMRYHSDKNEMELSDRKTIDGIVWEAQWCKNCQYYKEADEFEHDHRFYSRCGLMPEIRYLDGEGNYLYDPPTEGAYAATSYIVSAQGLCTDWNVKKPASS